MSQARKTPTPITPCNWCGQLVPSRSVAVVCWECYEAEQDADDWLDMDEDTQW